VPYPSKALQEYVLKSEIAGIIATGGVGPAGPAGASGAQGPAGASWTPIQSSTAPSIVSNGTIATAGLTVTRVAPTVDVTGIILASGTVAGQEVAVLNESAFSITFAARATSHVSTGTGSVILANTVMQFAWNSVTTAWYPISGLIATGPGGTGTFGTATFGAGTFGG
jgi:hypothetical protein